MPNLQVLGDIAIGVSAVITLIGSIAAYRRVRDPAISLQLVSAACVAAGHLLAHLLVHMDYNGSGLWVVERSMCVGGMLLFSIAFTWFWMGGSLRQRSA